MTDCELPVFARDKAICAFSGLSVWALDYATAPFCHWDWVDHVKPRSRGGGHTLDNLVCASYFHNYKKASNSSDKDYLFRDGKPTEMFFWTHGEVSEDQAALLKRNQAITETDWLINKAIANFHIALGNEYDRAEVSRKREHWLSAAWKRLETWRKLTGGDGSTFIKRGLVKYPKSKDVKLLLSLTKADKPQLIEIFQELAVHHDANLDLYDKFLKAKSRQRREEILDKAITRGRVTEAATDVMRINNARLDNFS